MSKVLMLNGSAREKGCTFTALTEVGKELEKQGIAYEIFQLGGAPVRDCIGCGQCAQGVCVFNEDRLQEFLKKAEEADGFIFGSPVYYAHPSGRILSFLDRAFYSGSRFFAFKPAAAVASARRAGTTATLDVLEKYFGISKMPAVGATYWNMVHGQTPEEVLLDKEGLQTMRNVGKNLAWLIKCLEAGKAAGIEIPAQDTENRTNFIRE